jgi:small conductance mechanosensitive channel
MNWLSLLPIIVPIIGIGVVAVGGYLLSRWAAHWLRQRGGTPGQVRGVRIAISVIGFVVAAVIFFSAFGPVSAISSLTVSAVLGLAATLALQTTISNVIAGFILLRDRVLRLDDTVTIGGITGRVVRIGLVTSWLRLDDGSLASVSNSNLLSGPLINRSAKDRLGGEY